MWQTAAMTALLMTVLPVNAAAQDAKIVLENASRAMGATGLESITYSGLAGRGNFGQSRTISFGLASTTIKNYTRTIDFTQSASRVTGVAVPPVVAGGPPPVPRLIDETTRATSGWSQQLEIWATPWGFLRGAAANNATVRSRKIDGVTYNVVTWIPPQKVPSGQMYRVVGYLNPAIIVDRIETWVEHAVLGDLHVEFTYGDYRDVGGLKVPTKIAQRQAGMETFVAQISQEFRL